jgi:hypothetical protein
MTSRKKAFGTGNVPQTTDDSPTRDSSNWSGGIKEGAARIEGLKNINAKTLPIELLEEDPENPRTLLYDSADIKALIQEHPLPDEFTGSTDWIASYVKQAPCPTSSANAEDSDAAARKELISLLYFAVSLGSSDKIINPITVFPAGSNFQIIAGERRFLACLLLLATHAPVRILDTRPAPDELLLMQWSENADREDLSLYDRLGNLRRIMTVLKTDNSGKEISIREFATKTGMSKTWAERYVTVIKHAKKALWEDIRLGKVNSIVTAHSLVQKARSKDKEVKGAPRRAKLRLTVGEDTQAAKFVIEAVVEKLADAQLGEKLEKLDYNDPRTINKALEEIMEVVSQHGG